MGARLFYVIEYWESRIRQDDWWGTLKNVLAFTEGGLVVYGAFAGAMAGFALCMWRRKLPALAIADIVAPGMMVGLALGRVGCLLNGCCYGGESTLPWAVTFPRENAPQSLSPLFVDQASSGRFHGFALVRSESDDAWVVQRVHSESPAERAGLQAGDVVSAVDGARMGGENHAERAILDSLREARPLLLQTSRGTVEIPPIEPPDRTTPVHPAQAYSTIEAGLLAWVLWSFFPFRRRDGEVMALMLVLHPISRFLLEEIRVDESPVWNTGWSISQNLSVGLLAIGVGLLVFLPRRRRDAPPLAGGAAGQRTKG
ncbi:MAG TPA: prolipoprotein diacylglyceryl transferase, partial [Lacipirellulaceae bacterium]|nr:prolipoprotein diacylglyceryl transferase [Lacipirellulaceae bacterium]